MNHLGHGGLRVAFLSRTASANPTTVGLTRHARSPGMKYTLMVCNVATSTVVREGELARITRGAAAAAGAPQGQCTTDGLGQAAESGEECDGGVGEPVCGSTLQTGRTPTAGVDNRCQAAQAPRMSRQTMSFALPESMPEYIDNRVAAGNDGNTSEYIRDLVRRDQEEQAKNWLRDLIEEGLASGPGQPRTKAVEKELLAIARGEID